MTRSIIHLFVECNCIRLTNFWKRFYSISSISPLKWRPMIPYVKSVILHYILMIIMKIIHCMRLHNCPFQHSNRFTKKWTTSTIGWHFVISDDHWHSSVLQSIYVSKWWLNLLMVLVFISQLFNLRHLNLTNRNWKHQHFNEWSCRLFKAINKTI